MAHKGSTRPLPSSSDIPDKLYFRIGDVAKLCEVPAYVLRFWESEFPQLKPNKGGTGQRLYRRKDVEMALRIKRLLYEEGYTIPGARQIFKLGQLDSGGPQLALAIQSVTASSSTKDLRRLRVLRTELQELHGLLSRPVTEKSSTLPIRAVKIPRASHGLALASRNAIPSMDDLFGERTTSLSDAAPYVGD